MSWFWMALGAAILWGLGYTINQLTLKHFNSLELLFFQAALISVTFMIYFIYKGDFGSFIGKLSNPKQLALIIISSVVYIIASILIFKSISSSNASLAAVIEACYPVFTALFAFILLGEIQFNIVSGIGVILIIAGIIIVKLYGK
ncbi:MAG: hypothetical protein K0R14_873 [Burkholderiales bacterium]|jgi:uncharacterized membrane protein|nr:hypothetical protein [Burkholderiales bacterium]